MRPQGKSQDTLERLYLSECLGVPLDRLEMVAGERVVWASLLGLLKMDGWTSGNI